ncbi:hypothetical protein SAMN02745121_08887 [Nannocystis exedens]|uniref:Tetratricopeptide repeat-containing protein n=1 Tax=Nannocystis exedens TaxID=54 RepID=A0A1I2IPK2_9BACT|nr:hypothetical protein [Nannocystis exedens]PCC69111.1 hypothetical protein NAEX_02133 [Nannocystis exedens]SFF44342.1 hypothetical protein SAMN02745121_08887 [Nannocystis exedens]
MDRHESSNTIDPRLEALLASVGRLAEVVRADDLDPSPLRHDWGAHDRQLDEVRRLVRDEILPAADAALAVAADPEAARVRQFCADVLGDAAGLLCAARDHEAAMATVTAAARLGAGTEAGALAAEGVRDLENFTQLIRAWWLVRHQRRDEARLLARKLSGLSLLPTLVASARVIVDAPEPLKRAPVLFTFNGCGVRVYGQRDVRSDGTYVTTRYATFLFVPLVPIDAYRVAAADEGGYYILHREPLSRATRTWRWLFLASLLVAALSVAASRYFGSPDYRLATAIAEIQREEPGAEREALLGRYEAALAEFPEAGIDTALPAIEAIVRLATADLAEPLTVAEVPRLKRVIRRFEALPRSVRGERGTQPMVARIEALAAQLGEDSDEAVDAQIRLLTDARRLVDGAESERLAGRQRALRLALAGRIADAWPLRAIRIYAASADDPQAVTAAAALIDRLDDGPSQWLELADAIETWLGAARGLGSLDAAVARASERLRAARGSLTEPGRAELLAGGDVEALRAALGAAPGDQAIAVALAQAQRGAGDLEGASATLTAFGGPGRLVLDGQVALASVWSELGRVDEAESLLRRVLIDRLPAFEDARAAYVEARTEETQRFVDRARAGDLPPDLAQRLDRAPEPEQAVIFTQWLEQQLAESWELKPLLAAYTAAAEVVPVALLLGTIQLQRAGGLEGEARAAALNAAEQTFLSIQAEAEGVPSYHLGLGEVYHRLGKRDEGDREFASLLAADDQAIALEVAHAYRGLGMNERARSLSEKVYAAASSPIREGAAMLRSLLATTLEEQRTWVERSDLTNPGVRRKLASIEAEELMTKGAWAQADRKLAEVLEGYLAEAETQGSSANNAAVTMLQRYHCTGERRMLDEAVRVLEKSRRLAPDSAVVVSNLAGAVDVLAAVTLASAWVDIQRLPLGQSEAKDVLAALARGRTRTALNRRVREEPLVQRALDLYRQTAILAPRGPDPYESEGSWFDLAEDVDALRELLARVERLESLDSSDAVVARERHLRGDDDELTQTTLSTLLGRLDLRIAKLDRRRHGPTLAAATLLRGTYLETQSNFDGAERALEAGAAYHLAHEIWPALGSRADETRALVTAAGHRAARDSSEFGAVWAAELRRIGITNILLTLARAPESANAAALRATPEFGRALASLGERGEEELQLLDWAVATIGRDAAHAERAREALTRESRRLLRRLDARLDPGDARTSELLAHLDALTGG